MATKKREKMRKFFVGTKTFTGDPHDVTDPSYDKDVWCRVDGLKVVPGDYDCVVWITGLPGFERIGIIGIYLGGVVPNQSSMKAIGEIGVDAGLAGFFENKPDYTRGEWHDFCDYLRDSKAEGKSYAETHAWIRPEGFFSSSGEGDGGYTVYARKDRDGRATAVEIRFM